MSFVAISFGNRHGVSSFWLGFAHSIHVVWFFCRVYVTFVTTPLYSRAHLIDTWCSNTSLSECDYEFFNKHITLVYRSCVNH